MSQDKNPITTESFEDQFQNFIKKIEKSINGFIRKIEIFTATPEFAKLPYERKKQLRSILVSYKLKGGFSKQVFCHLGLIPKQVRAARRKKTDLGLVSQELIKLSKLIKGLPPEQRKMILPSVSNMAKEN